VIQFGADLLNLVGSSASIPFDLEKLEKTTDDVYIVVDHKVDINDFASLKCKILPEEEWKKISKYFHLVQNEHLSSDCLKIPIVINNTFFTTIFNLIPFVYKMYKASPSAYFILNRPDGNSHVDEVAAAHGGMFEYVQEFFTYLGINFVWVDWDAHKTAFKSKGVLDLGVNGHLLDVTLADVLETAELMKEHIGLKDVKPFRKVYLSRRHLSVERGAPHVLKGGGTNRFDSDIRMYNEEVLEEYFRSKGYEVISSEMYFKTFKDQIAFFHEVEVLAGVSGSGFTNLIFMQDNQTAVDITAELVFSNGELGALQVIDSQHWLYNSYMKHHLHISIPSRRDPRRVIEKIESISNRINLF
jgi:hypothetical protein